MNEWFLLITKVFCVLATGIFIVFLILVVLDSSEVPTQVLLDKWNNLPIQPNTRIHVFVRDIVTLGGTGKQGSPRIVMVIQPETIGSLPSKKSAEEAPPFNNKYPPILVRERGGKVETILSLLQEILKSHISLGWRPSKITVADDSDIAEYFKRQLMSPIEVDFLMDEAKDLVKTGLIPSRLLSSITDEFIVDQSVQWATLLKDKPEIQIDPLTGEPTVIGSAAEEDNDGGSINIWLRKRGIFRNKWAQNIFKLLDNSVLFRKKKNSRPKLREVKNKME